MLARALELVMQEPEDQSSAFAWVKVQLNPPGMEGYDPGLPRVRCIHIDWLVAAFLCSYFDDCWVAGPTSLLAEQALCQATASCVQFLGNQDASRERQWVSQQAGAWTGSVTYTDQDMACKLIT